MTGPLADQVVRLNLPVDGVFDLVGNSALRDSLRIARPGGRVCQLGFLGGLEPVAEFNPIADVPTGVQFSFYGSAFVLGTESFPLADIPLQEMIAKAESGRYRAKPVEGVRLRGDRGGAPRDGAGPGRRKDGRRSELGTVFRGVRPAEAG